MRKEWKNEMPGLEQMNRCAQAFRGGHIHSGWRRDDMRSQEDEGHVHGFANDDANDHRENASYDSLHDFYQRSELRHAGPNDVNREAELEQPSRVTGSDLFGKFFLIS